MRHINCPNCSATLQLPSGKLPPQLRCRACQGVFLTDLLEEDLPPPVILPPLPLPWDQPAPIPTEIPPRRPPPLPESRAESPAASDQPFRFEPDDTGLAAKARLAQIGRHPVLGRTMQTAVGLAALHTMLVPCFEFLPRLDPRTPVAAGFVVLIGITVTTLLLLLVAFRASDEMSAGKSWKICLTGLTSLMLVGVIKGLHAASFILLIEVRDSGRIIFYAMLSVLSGGVLAVGLVGLGAVGMFLVALGMNEDEKDAAWRAREAQRR